jgi:hypothetical protein
MPLTSNSGLNLPDLQTSGLTSLYKTESLSAPITTVNSSASSYLEQVTIPSISLPTNSPISLPIGNGTNSSNSINYLTSPAVLPDFNGDGKTDQVWVNAQTGTIEIRLMNGAQVLQQGSLGSFGGSSGLNSWSYSLGDFNGDGKTDFLLHNKTTGANELVLMNGVQVANLITLQSLAPEWTPTVGYFQGDRETDILWHDTKTGQNTVWIMNANNTTSPIVSTAVLANTTANAIPTVVDFNANGKDDILWRNPTTGANSVWFMNGAQETSYNLQSQDPAWTFTLGNFSGSGRTDLLWHNSTTGQNQIWSMNGIIATETTLNTLDTAWTSSIGDFNGDGKSDILWHNQQNGQNMVWLMNGGSLTTQALLPTNSANETAVIGNFNGDGKSEIYWRDNAAGADQIWTPSGNGTTVTQTSIAESNQLSPIVVGTNGKPEVDSKGQPLIEWVVL